jgi:imidazole glycerol-phosphate synthase subunit HisH
MADKAVVIVDLGLGNLRSVARALMRSGAEPTITADPEALRRAPAVVVPGQGAFRDCAAALERGFGPALREFIATGKPYLGLCLGMQVLFEGSEECPGSSGLGLFRGLVRRFAKPLYAAPGGEQLKVPHIGWNQVRGAHPLLPNEGWFYFVHSYCCVPDDASLTVGSADYGGPFCAAIARDNVFACQFHPEKSQEEGRLLLDRFVAGVLGRPSARAVGGL